MAKEPGKLPKVYWRGWVVLTYANILAFVLRERAQRAWGVLICAALFAFVMLGAAQTQSSANLMLITAHFIGAGMIGGFYPDGEDEFLFAQIIYETILHVDQTWDKQAVAIKNDIDYRSLKVCMNICGYYLGRELVSISPADAVAWLL